MKILSAIGRFFARIGRWIKETAWIQPLLIVGAIFAIIFAIPHVIRGVQGWFSSSNDANKFFAQYRLSLTGADKDNNEFGGSSDVDKFLSYIDAGDKKEEVVKIAGGERFFVAFIKKGAADDLSKGLKEFRDNFGKNSEFKNLNGKFKLLTIYTDTTNDDDENLFDMTWRNHYSLFEDMANGNFLPTTPYAVNNSYSADKYASNFVTKESEDKCPMNTPLVMYFNYSEEYEVENQKVKGLSDVLFSVEGGSDLEKARTLKRCWSHVEEFKDIKVGA